MRKKKIILFSILSTLIFVIALAGFVTYAFFSTRVKVYTADGKELYAQAGMKLDLLFDRISGVDAGTCLYIKNRSALNNQIDAAWRIKNPNASPADYDGYCYYDPDAKWGSKNNPYIISNIKHLQNLSALQEVGYFTSYTEQFDPTANGGAGNGAEAMPYFLVCSPNGKPIGIDGTGKTIKPIGDDNNPFIGYVGGAFARDPITKQTNASDAAYISKTDIEADESIIYNINVKTTDDVLDVGLFGTVGYLGSEASILDIENITNIQHDVIDYLSTDNPTTTIVGFTGGVSTIENLVLYDVQIVVNKPTIIENIGELINRHYYQYKTPLGTEKEDFTFKETHHAGIVAGHISYCNMEYISVYYSSTDVKAFDIDNSINTYNGKNANYYSQSCIVGMIYNMNPVALGGYVAPNEQTNSVIEGATGTGGGSLSGSGRGYVTASEVYSMYNGSGNIVSYEYDNVIQYSLLIIKENGKYYLPNHTNQTDYELTISNTSTSENVSGIATITEEYRNFFNGREERSTQWSSFIVKDGNNYYHLNDTSIPIAESDISKTGIYIRYGYNAAQNEELCQQWIRNRLIFGTQATGEFYFTDGVFTFALSTNQDTIENTWGSSPDKFLIGYDDRTKWQKNNDKGLNAVLAYASEIKTNAELQEAAEDGKTIFILAETDTNSDGSKSLFLMNLADATGTSTTTQGAPYSTISTSTLEQLVAAFDGGLYNEAEYAGSAPRFQTYNSDMTYEELRSKIYDGEIGSTQDDDNWIVIDLGAIDLESGKKALEDKNKILANKANNGQYVYSLVSSLEVENPVTNYDGLIANVTEGTYNVFETDSNASWTNYYCLDIVSGEGFYLCYNSIESDNNETLIHSWTSGNPTLKTVLEYAKTDPELTSDFTGNRYGQEIYNLKDDANKVYQGPAILIIHTSNGYTLVDGTPVTVNTRTHVVTPTYRTNFTYISASNRFVSDTNIKYIYREYNTELKKYVYYDKDNNELINVTANTKVENGDIVYYPFTGNYKNNPSRSYTGALVDRISYFYFTNGDGKNTQYLLHKQEKYTVRCGGTSIDTYTHTFEFRFGPLSGVPSSSSNIKYYYQQYCSIVNIDGDCYIQYVYEYSDPNDSSVKYTTTRYLYYSNDSFVGSTTRPTSTTPIHIFVLEAFQSTSGYATIVPTEGNTVAELSANQYVLWPNTSLHPSETNAHRVTKSDNPLYYVVPISKLGAMEDAFYNKTSESSGWINGTGDATITTADLSKKFKMLKGIDTGTSIALFNGVLNAEGFITAPVGSLGVEANIPLGTVAFRVNKSLDTGLFIRVIVSVATSAYFNSEDSDNYIYSFDNDYYLALWHSEASGDSLITRFDNQNYMEKVEIPRSNRYDPDDVVNSYDDQDYPYENFIKVVYDPANNSGTSYNLHTDDINDYTYRSYMNGNRVLMAYTFKVTEEGVYVLGVEGDLKNGDTMPMEIVYFSVDGTASAGRDGATGSMLGTVDFVYDDGNGKILTVKSSSDDGGTADYTNFYYSSLCRIFTNNVPGVDLNQLGCSVVRSVVRSQSTDVTKITIKKNKEQDEYVDGIRLDPTNSDEIEETE